MPDHDHDHDHDRELRARIYRYFVAGRPPTGAELTAGSGLSAREVDAALDRLADAHELVLVPGTHDIWMAHPFSAIPTDYRVVAPTEPRRSWWANCAWDAIALAGLVGGGIVRVRSRADGAVWEARVDDRGVTPDHVIHFSVPARRFWDDIGFT